MLLGSFPVFGKLYLFLFLFSFKNLPESSKFHVLQGRTDAAVSCLKRVAQANCQNMIPGRLVQDDFFASEKRGAVSDLFLKSLRKTTLLLWFIWYGALSFFIIIYFVFPGDKDHSRCR